MKKVIWIICIGLAVALFLLSGNETNAPDYTSFSAKPYGASLLYDTLKHMGYSVASGQTTVDNHSPVNDVFIVIRPNNPYVDYEMAEAMLSWVKKGGRMIFLDGPYPTIMDHVLHEQPYVEMGTMTYYTAGMGEVITGNADEILNHYLMYEGEYGRLIEAALETWSPNRIWFAEYYHGYRVHDNFINSLPVIVKLAGVQLLIITAVIIWHIGKRFGKPVPYYEEVEREENEHVKALARLYIAAGRK